MIHRLNPPIGRYDAFQFLWWSWPDWFTWGWRTELAWGLLDSLALGPLEIRLWLAALTQRTQR